MDPPQMNPILDIGVRLSVFFMMIVVGTELTVADFRRIFRYPRAVLVGTAAQLVALPAMGGVLILALPMPPELVAGLILLASAPGGGISNVLASVARVNVPLSVTLTGLSGAASLLTMPLLASAGFALYLASDSGVDAPLEMMVAQLLLMLIIPAGLGMTLRARAPGFVERWDPVLRGLNAVLLALLIAAVLFDQWSEISDGFGPAIASIVVFHLGAVALGWGTAWLLGLPSADRFTFLIEFACRNVAVAFVIATTVLGRLEYSLFAGLYGFVQLPVLLGLIALYRMRGERGP